jgi:hypothetical protein
MNQGRCERTSNPLQRTMQSTSAALSKGNRLLCAQCFSAEVAKRGALTTFRGARPEPIQMIDCAGEAVFQLVKTAGVLAHLRHLHHSRLGQ